jgi:GH24 family phage-related lysozyme (muramidase)
MTASMPIEFVLGAHLFFELCRWLANSNLRKPADATHRPAGDDVQCGLQRRRELASPG